VLLEAPFIGPGSALEVPDVPGDAPGRAPRHHAGTLAGAVLAQPGEQSRV
jgi:hypothetical protein